jgi:hypothetical protein
MLPDPFAPPEPIVVHVAPEAPAPDPLQVFREEHAHTHEAHAQEHEALSAEIASLRADLAAAREAALTPVGQAPAQVEAALPAAAEAAGEVIALPAEAVETIPEKTSTERRPKRRRHAY